MTDPTMTKIVVRGIALRDAIPLWALDSDFINALCRSTATLKGVETVPCDARRREPHETHESGGAGSDDRLGGHVAART